jgi:hypothetical protein
MILLWDLYKHLLAQHRCNLEPAAAKYFIFLRDMARRLMARERESASVRVSESESETESIY